MAVSLRRSLLYVPGSSEKMIRKAGGRGADVLILDLEDGVHPDGKDEARERVTRLLGHVDFGGSEVFVRVNAPSSPWGKADLEMVATVRPLAVVLPKVEEPAVVQSIDDELDRSTALFLMVETAAGVLAAPFLARATARVSGLIFGAADYRESVRASRDPEEAELWFARSQILHAARAVGIDAFDTPWFAYLDLAGLTASARRVRRLGFDGKTAIHPQQVAILNDVFSPTPSEVARARRVVSVLEQALAHGRSVATLDGEMIEALHLQEARRILARAGEAAPESES